jgi:hypothetical protein
LTKFHLKADTQADEELTIEELNEAIFRLESSISNVEGEINESTKTALATIPQLLMTVNDPAIQQVLSKLLEALKNDDSQIQVTRRKRQTPIQALLCNTLTSGFVINSAALKKQISQLSMRISIVRGVLSILRNINQPILQGIIVWIEFHEILLEQLIRYEYILMTAEFSFIEKCAAYGPRKLKC